MDYDTGAFFSEHADDDVKAFAIIDMNEDSGQYRVAEKWERDDRNGGPTWVTYWIPEAALNERIKNGECSFKQDLSDKQFRGILNLADVSGQYKVPA